MKAWDSYSDQIDESLEAELRRRLRLPPSDSVWAPYDGILDGLDDRMRAWFRGHEGCGLCSFDGEAAMRALAERGLLYDAGPTSLSHWPHYRRTREGRMLAKRLEHRETSAIGRLRALSEEVEASASGAGATRKRLHPSRPLDENAERSSARSIGRGEAATAARPTGERSNPTRARIA